MPRILISNTTRYLWLPEDIFQPISLSLDQGEYFQAHRLLIIWLLLHKTCSSRLSGKHIEKSREIQNKILAEKEPPDLGKSFFQVTSNYFLNTRIVARKINLDYSSCKRQVYSLSWDGRFNGLRGEGEAAAMFVVGMVMRISCDSPPSTPLF